MHKIVFNTPALFHYKRTKSTIKLHNLIKMYNKIFTLVIYCFLIINCSAQQTASFNITGYYAGSAERLDSFPLEKLTHIIYSFGHLKGNKLHINNAKDSACIKKMVAFK